MFPGGIEPGTVARDILEAVREAIDIPNAATVGDQEIRDGILLDRLGHAVVMLASILDEPSTTDILWSIAYLRARLAEHPAAGYRTWEQALSQVAHDAEQAARIALAASIAGGNPLSQRQLMARFGPATGRRRSSPR